MMRTTKLNIPIRFLLVLASFAFVLNAGAMPVSGKEAALLKKNFYLLYVLQQAKLETNPVMQRLTDSRKIRLSEALQTCKTSSCLVSALQLSTEEVRTIGDELVRLATTDKTWVTQLRASKTQINFDTGDNESLIRKSWDAAAQALNRILGVYINGDKITYPKIDAGDFKPTDPAYFQRLKQMLGKLSSRQPGSPYEQLMIAGIRVLLLNGRDEAIRYEPLEKGWNKDAFKQLRKTDWSKYAYSAILVPGLGPEEAGVRLDPNGALRCDSAAKRYRAGLAPFIVVSGGHVHPNKTPFNEAVEMKKYMVEKLKIPASAIFIEPHARHTTTNLRNANRMVYRFNMPANKKILIVTDQSQSAYIRGNMTKAAARDLGYDPHKALKKISETETEYLPNEASLHVNPLDPLDPR